jgi:hypothetical protein
MGALNIKDADVAKKARKLAKLKGTTITAAVSQALDESLRAAANDREAREKRIDEALARFRAAIPPDAPSYEEIMEDMYDENGAPR